MSRVPGSEFLHTPASEVIPSPEGETWQRVIVVSNRLPFKVVTNGDGTPTLLKSAGGLVTAMSPLLHEGGTGKWIGWPGTVEEEGLEEALRSKPNGSFDVGVVGLTPEEEKGYYEGYSNEVLTPLLTGQMDQVDLEKAERYWPIYQQVQRKFAHKIHEDLKPHDIVWIQDYHLMGVGKELLDLGIKQPVGYFLHTPFPTPEQFATLPQSTALIRDLLSYDLLGFQTEAFKKNFLETVALLLPNAVIQEGEDGTTISYATRTTRVGSFPISIDPQEFTRQRDAEDTQRHIKRLEQVLEANDVQMVFNVGRLDYSKGFYEELLAFDRMLEQHPELIGKIVLYQLVVPSREDIPAYKEYKEKIVELARQINEKYKTAIVQEEESSDESSPRYRGRVVRQLHDSMGRARYIAHLHEAEIQSVPTLSDGMNLVAKESAVVGGPSTVQILGEAAGAAEELGDYVLLIDPQDTQAYADALYRAYTMSDTERQERKEKMAATVTENDVFSWWSQDQEPMFQAIWDKKAGVKKN
ncbi:trehalose-6-phosphate synthase [Patescibacteria group bacterium]|nr:trehalose-6-phosphate synthase [Patescibacteria group bacterium]